MPVWLLRAARKSWTRLRNWDPGLWKISNDQKSRQVCWVGGARVTSIVLGVVIPLTALVVEAVTSMSSEIFDPIPTLWHMLAIAFVAFSNGWTTVILAKEQLAKSRWLTGAIGCNAVAIGISVYYAIWFIPITPFAVIGIIAMGLGLLPLSPLLAMITGLLLRKKLRERAGVCTATWPKNGDGGAGGVCRVAGL